MLLNFIGRDRIGGFGRVKLGLELCLPVVGRVRNLPQFATCLPTAEGLGSDLEVHFACGGVVQRVSLLMLGH